MEDVYTHSLQQFVYKCVNDNPILNFKNYFVTRGTNNPNTLNLRNSGQLHIPTVSTEIGRKSVKFSGANLWNNNSNYLKASKSIHIFKKRLFNFLMTQYT